MNKLKNFLGGKASQDIQALNKQVAQTIHTSIVQKNDSKNCSSEEKNIAIIKQDTDLQPQKFNYEYYEVNKIQQYKANEIKNTRELPVIDHEGNIDHQFCGVLCSILGDKTSIIENAQLVSQYAPKNLATPWYVFINNHSFLPATLISYMQTLNKSKEYFLDVLGAECSNNKEVFLGNLNCHVEFRKKIIKTIILNQPDKIVQLLNWNIDLQLDDLNQIEQSMDIKISRYGFLKWLIDHSVINEVYFALLARYNFLLNAFAKFKNKESNVQIQQKTQEVQQKIKQTLHAFMVLSEIMVYTYEYKQQLMINEIDQYNQQARQTIGLECVIFQVNITKRTSYSQKIIIQPESFDNFKLKINNYNVINTVCALNQAIILIAGYIYTTFLYSKNTHFDISEQYTTCASNALHLFKRVCVYKTSPKYKPEFTDLLLVTMLADALNIQFNAHKCKYDNTIIEQALDRNIKPNKTHQLINEINQSFAKVNENYNMFLVQYLLYALGISCISNMVDACKNPLYRSPKDILHEHISKELFPVIGRGGFAVVIKGPNATAIRIEYIKKPKDPLSDAKKIQERSIHVYGLLKSVSQELKHNIVKPIFYIIILNTEKDNKQIKDFDMQINRNNKLQSHEEAKDDGASIKISQLNQNNEKIVLISYAKRYDSSIKQSSAWMFKEDNKINIYEIYHFTIKCLQMIHCMHSNGLIHSDIKLENILVKKKGSIQRYDSTKYEFVIIDFLGVERGSQIAFGTKEYLLLKDHQHRNPIKMTERIDNHAFGIVMIFILNQSIASSLDITPISNNDIFDYARSGKVAQIVIRLCCLLIMKYIDNQNHNNIKNNKSQTNSDPNLVKNLLKILIIISRLFDMHLSIQEIVKQEKTISEKLEICKEIDQIIDATYLYKSNDEHECSAHIISMLKQHVKLNEGDI